MVALTPEGVPATDNVVDGLDVGCASDCDVAVFVVVDGVGTNDVGRVAVIVVVVGGIHTRVVHMQLVARFVEQSC